MRNYNDKIYSKLTYNKIREAIGEFFNKHEYCLPSIQNWGRKHVVIRDKGLFAILSKNEFNRILDEVILKETTKK